MTALARLERMPDWPARMTADVAAMYMGMSIGSFRTRYGALGLKEGANVYWARRQLDGLIDRQFDLAAPSRAKGRSAEPVRDTSWDDLR